MKIDVPFLFYKKVSEFRKCFEKEFLGCNLVYKGIRVTFAKDDFKHICYEAGKGGIKKAKFGFRRARRLLFIKDVLKEKIPAELRFQPERGNYCLLCEELDFVMFLNPVSKTKTLQIGTIIHYGSGFTKAINKQKAESIPVDKIEFSEENESPK